LENQFFSPRIIAWYQHNRRDLPWRHTRDPYKIWLSEVILQQTRVAQGMPYYLRFVEAYPTVFDLAAAPEQEVMRLWQGLGYYSRARNLHQTAQFIAQQRNGLFPDTFSSLLQLKGIGTYTAAAIASFAFDEPVAVVDGNVYRVLSRVFGIETDIASTAGQKEFWTLANTLIPPDQAAVFNQAMMEFGAIQCTPTSPDCLLCPLQAQCQANATGKVAALPVKSKKVKVKERFFNYFVVAQNGQLALKQRNTRDIWQQLYDFYLVESDAPLTSIDALDDATLRDILPQVIIEPPARAYTHVLTHQRIQAQFWVLHAPDTLLTLPSELQFFSHEAIEALPKPVLITAYWKERFL
jgi:A/G-specific adenine glycosylase